MSGNWSCSEAVTDLLPASSHRSGVEIQHYGGDAVFLAFGQDAVVGSGIRLSKTFPLISIKDYRAKLVIRGVCESGKSATGGYASA